MARLPIPGGDDGAWGTVLNEFLRVEHNGDGTLKDSGSLSAKADDAAVVHLSGTETISGNKNFTGTLKHNGSDLIDSSLVIGSGTGLTGGGNLSTNRTLSVVDDTTTQKVEIANGGTYTGARKRINFIEGDNIAITANDNNGSNRVDVTIAAVSSASLVVNVKDYGATGDGSTDDTAAITAAHEAARDNFNGQIATVYFPAGIYITSSPISLYDGMSWSGPIGAGEREFENRSVIRNSTTDFFTMSATTKDISIENLAFRGDTTDVNTNWLATEQVLEYSTIRNCAFKFFAHVIDNTVLGLHFKDNYLNNCSDTLLVIGGSDSYFKDNFMDSDLAGAPTAKFMVDFIAASYMLFEGNYVTCCPSMGMRIDGGGNNTIAFNKFNGLSSRGNGSDGSALYIVDTFAIQVIGNLFGYNVQNPFAQYDGVVGVFDSSGITFTDNTFHNQITGRTMYRIGQSSSTTDTIKIKGTVYRSAVSELVTTGTVTNIAWDEWAGKYKTGAGARIANSDYPATPPNGTTGVVYDTTTSQTLVAQKANDTWHHFAVSGAGVPQTSYMVTTTDQTATGSNTYADAAGLAWTVSAGEVWMLTGQLVYDGPTTGDMKFQFVVPSATTWYGNIDGLLNTSTAVAGQVVRTALGSASGVAGTQVAAIGIGTRTVALVTGWFSVTNNGTIKIQFAQGTADAGTSTLYTNSFLYATRLS